MYYSDPLADGRTIVYARYDAGTWDLYLTTDRESGGQKLTSGSKADNTQPAFSPNRPGNRFPKRAGRWRDLRHGYRQRRRPANRRFRLSSRVVPDGSKIAFSTGTFADPAENSVGQPSSLRIVESHTEAVRTFASRAMSWRPFNPNGRRTALASLSGDGTIKAFGIFGQSQPKATPQARLVSPTHDIWTDWSPTWSPDGRSLYYSSDRGGSMNLWRVAIDEKSGQVSGSPEPVTTPSAYSGWPVFSKDGSRFAYVRRIFSSRLYRISFDPEHGGGKDGMQPITTGARRVREPDMSPRRKTTGCSGSGPTGRYCANQPQRARHSKAHERQFQRSPAEVVLRREIHHFSVKPQRTIRDLGYQPDGSDLRQSPAR